MAMDDSVLNDARFAECPYIIHYRIVVIRTCAVRLLICFRDGVSRCGVYCVVSSTWDRLGSEQQVDVFQAVQNVRHNRPQLVCDKVVHLEY